MLERLNREGHGHCVLTSVRSVSMRTTAYIVCTETILIMTNRVRPKSVWYVVAALVALVTVVGE